MDLRHEPQSTNIAPMTPPSADGSRDRTALPPVPVHDLTGEASPPLALMGHERERLATLVRGARRRYTPPVIAVADRLSRRWLARNTTPYRDEIAAIADRLDHPGGHFLNVSFEWSCTCGVAPDPAGAGMRMLRVLDWPLPGLGRDLVVTRQDGPAGQFFNLTWPGFVGTVTALAPGRFAAALNQAPIPSHGIGWMGDWLIERMAVWRSREVPPMHLLRQVMEGCRTYRDARHALTYTPIALPALFILAGAVPGEGCVIERTPGGSRIHEAPVSGANCWLTPGRDGKPRGRHSAARRHMMESLLAHSGDGFDWLAPPILNPTTRVVCEMNPATGTLIAQGWEADGPATALLRLDG